MRRRHGAPPADGTCAAFQAHTASPRSSRPRGRASWKEGLRNGSLNVLARIAIALQCRVPTLRGGGQRRNAVTPGNPELEGVVCCR